MVLLVGLALGWAMSLFSAQDLMSGAIMKGAVGFVAGLLADRWSNLSPVVFVAGCWSYPAWPVSITLFVLKLSVQQDWWWAVWTIVLPQACLDAVLGGAIYWLMWSRLNIEQLMSESRM